MVAIITKNITLAKAPGNVLIAAQDSGLPLDSIVNVSQVITLDKSLLTEYISCLSPLIMAKIDDGLRLAMSL